MTVNPLLRRESINSRAARYFNSVYRSTEDFFSTKVNIVATDEEVDNLRIAKYSEIKDDESFPQLEICSMTQEIFEDDTDVIILPCTHYFKVDLLKKWLLEHSNKCPICRFEVCKGKPSY